MFGIHRLRTPEERGQAALLVGGFDENDGIESRGFFVFGAVMTGLFILTIATTSVMPVLRELGMGYVALTFALIMMVRYKATVDRFYKAVDWDLLGFFAALFIFIHVVEEARVLHAIGQGLEWMIGLGPNLGAGAVLVGSAAFSSVTDNIPLAAMLSNILVTLEVPSDSSLWWSVVFGANLGGNLTPIGSASTLVAVTIMHKHKLGVTFGRFVRLAIVYAAAQIALATAYVLLFL